MTRVEHLKALLTALGAAIDVAEPKELAALSREKRLILAELDSLSGLNEGSAIDELKHHRARRRAAAGVGKAADGGHVKRSG